MSTRCRESSQLIKYAPVKEGIFNPYQTKLRRCEMDSQLGKLHDEHLKTTLPKGVENFPAELFYQYHPPHRYVMGFDILPLYAKELRQSQEMKELSFLENPQLAHKWAEFIQGLPLSEKRVIHLPAIRDFHFKNYYVRYWKPDIAASWRKTLKPGLKLDAKCQLPIPANNLHQYRNV